MSVNLHLTQQLISTPVEYHSPYHIWRRNSQASAAKEVPVSHEVWSHRWLTVICAKSNLVASYSNSHLSFKSGVGQCASGGVCALLMPNNGQGRWMFHSFFFFISLNNGFDLLAFICFEMASVFSTAICWTNENQARATPGRDVADYMTNKMKHLSVYQDIFWVSGYADPEGKACLDLKMPGYRTWKNLSLPILLSGIHVGYKCNFSLASAWMEAIYEILPYLSTAFASYLPLSPRPMNFWLHLVGA